MDGNAMHQHVVSFPPDRPSRGRSRYPYWRTKAGVAMRLEDMTERHLRNARALLERNAEALYPEWVAGAGVYRWIGCWGDTNGSEDEMIGAALEDNHWETLLPDAYHDMAAELERRGLTP